MNNDAVAIEWLYPWWHVSEERRDLGAGYERELRSELGSKHPLFAIPVTALGKHDGSDDVLFQMNDGSGRVALVHLTWAQHPEPAPWPATEFFPDLAAFAAQRMQRDHDEHET